MKIGIIGYGIVGRAFANILKTAGFSPTVYDVKFKNPTDDAMITVAQSGIAIAIGLKDLIDSVDYIFSTVTTLEAAKVADQCVPFLNSNHVFVDLNSTSSVVKKKIFNNLKASGASFIEGAILNSVASDSTTFDVLLSGENVQEVEIFLKSVGINGRFYSREVGKASDYKMVRSIFSKGLENLIIETLLTAQRAGIEDELWGELVKFMDSKSFGEIADTWVTSHVISYERRFQEMEQVLETMDFYGVESIMSNATSNFFMKSLSIDLKNNFSGQPLSKKTIIETYNNISSKQNNKWHFLKQQ